MKVQIRVEPAPEGSLTPFVYRLTIWTEGRATTISMTEQEAIAASDMLELAFKRGLDEGCTIESEYK